MLPFAEVVVSTGTADRGGLVVDVSGVEVVDDVIAEDDSVVELAWVESACVSDITLEEALGTESDLQGKRASVVWVMDSKYFHMQLTE